MWMSKSKRLKEMEPSRDKVNVKLKFLRILRFTSFAVALMLCPPLTASAILQNPDPSQVEEALNRGKESAREHHPPNELYWHFGPMEKFEPHGFLVTKVSALAVMSGHFALRGATAYRSRYSASIGGRRFASGRKGFWTFSSLCA